MSYASGLAGVGVNLAKVAFSAAGDFLVGRWAGRVVQSIGGISSIGGFVIPEAGLAAIAGVALKEAAVAVVGEVAKIAKEKLFPRQPQEAVG